MQNAVDYLKGKIHIRNRLGGEQFAFTNKKQNANCEKYIMEQMIKPPWLKIKEEEMKKIIAELAKKNSPAQIGLILRDQYGIPTTKLYGKKLTKYLEEQGIKTNPDLENIEKKLERIKIHLKKNITDKKTKHKIQKTQSRLNIVKKYLAKNSSRNKSLN